jgi:glycosyltransferase involved in cell wall biosynthesis
MKQPPPLNSPDDAPLTGIGCCWVGSARTAAPLDLSVEKKWRALGSLGMRMFVIGFSADVKSRVFTQHARFFLLPLLPTSPLRYLESLLCIPLVTLWLIARRDVRVLIAQSPAEGALAAAAKRLARLAGRRVGLIVESHGDFENSQSLYRRGLLSGLLGALNRGASRVGLRHADALRAISASTRQQLETWAPGKPVEQFMAWTDSEAFLSVKRAAPPSQSQVILYAGVLIPLKGIHVLLDALADIAARHPQARLKLAGAPQDRQYVAQITRQIAQRGLENRVEFIGEIAQMALAQQMAEARVLVLPSLSEGLGRVIVEAMLCGTPVIASRVGGIPDIVQDGVTGTLTPPGDVPALANALARALDDVEIDRMGDSARAFAQAFFSTEAYVEGHRRLIEAAIKTLSGDLP